MSLGFERSATEDELLRELEQAASALLDVGLRLAAARPGREIPAIRIVVDPAARREPSIVELVEAVVREFPGVRRARVYSHLAGRMRSKSEQPREVVRSTLVRMIRQGRLEQDASHRLWLPGAPRSRPDVQLEAESPAEEDEPVDREVV